MLTSSSSRYCHLAYNVKLESACRGRYGIDPLLDHLFDVRVCCVFLHLLEKHQGTLVLAESLLLVSLVLKLTSLVLKLNSTLERDLS